MALCQNGFAHVLTFSHLFLMVLVVCLLSLIQFRAMYFYFFNTTITPSFTVRVSDFYIKGTGFQISYDFKLWIVLNI